MLPNQSKLVVASEVTRWCHKHSEIEYMPPGSMQKGLKETTNMVYKQLNRSIKFKIQRPKRTMSSVEIIHWYSNGELLAIYWKHISSLEMISRGIYRKCYFVNFFHQVFCLILQFSQFSKQRIKIINSTAVIDFITLARKENKVKYSQKQFWSY